jgi:hypothetical protein
MWNYYLVEELIMNQKWIEENGNNWVTGRVECNDSENSYGYSNREYSLIIDDKDWNKFDDYLRSTETKELKNLDELIVMSQLPIVKFQNRLKNPS